MLEIVYSRREDGNMSSRYSMDGRDNRLSFFLKHDIDYRRTACLRCLNESIITFVDSESLSDTNESGDPIINGDALITKEKNILLYQMFGDCIPLVIYDDKQEILSLVHLGWIEIRNDLMIKVINTLINKYGSKVENLQTYLGPCIKRESYIIENPSQFGDSKWESYLDLVNDNNYMVDLEGYTVDRLKECGITNISVSDIDTCKDLNMFSNYKSNHTGERSGRFLFGVRMK